MVVVSPHPDDETIGAGGVTALHIQGGDRVTLVVVTDGGASHAGGLARDEMVALRQRELEAAAEILGVTRVVSLGLPENGWTPADAELTLAPLLAGADVIYAPSCVDYHPEHVGVARLVASLVRAGQTVRAYEVGVPLTSVLVNLVADIRPVARLKARSLEAYATQRATLTPLQRLARYRACLYGLPDVEVFWEMPAEAYASRMTAGDWRTRGCPFRGISPRPLGDPLAALVGRGARRSLRREPDGQMDAQRG